MAAFYHHVYTHGHYPPKWGSMLELAHESVLLMCTQIEKKGLGFTPSEDKILAAHEENGPDDVVVVIIGEGPYPHNATGHAFSSNTGMKESLRNVYKELERTIPGFVRPQHGCLMSWVDQGVMLLNKDLTTVPGKDRGHSGYSSGLLSMTIQTLRATKRKIIYLLWGKQAQEVKNMLKDSDIVLEAGHPSPVNRYGGFIGCNHFVTVNKILSSRGEKEIDWRIPANQSDRPYLRKPIAEQNQLQSLVPDQLQPLSAEQQQIQPGVGGGQVSEPQPFVRKLLVLKDSREDHL